MSDVTRTPSKRSALLQGEITHAEYYGMLFDLFGGGHLFRLLPIDEPPEWWASMIEEDPYLTNVQLHRWDLMHESVLRIPVDRDKLIAITGSAGWSRGDTVCLLKCAARRYAATAAKGAG